MTGKNRSRRVVKKLLRRARHPRIWNADFVVTSDRRFVTALQTLERNLIPEYALAVMR